MFSTCFENNVMFYTDADAGLDRPLGLRELEAPRIGCIQDWC